LLARQHAVEVAVLGVVVLAWIAAKAELRAHVVRKRSGLLVCVEVFDALHVEVDGEPVEARQHVVGEQLGVRVARDPDGCVFGTRVWPANQLAERARGEDVGPLRLHENSCSAQAPSVGMSSPGVLGITDQRNTCSPSGT